VCWRRQVLLQVFDLAWAVRSVNVLDYEVLANKLFYNFVQMFQISFSLHHSSSAIRVRQYSSMSIAFAIMFPKVY
jgi:hypothetical protein